MTDIRPKLRKVTLYHQTPTLLQSDFFAACDDFVGQLEKLRADCLIGAVRAPHNMAVHPHLRERLTQYSEAHRYRNQGPPTSWKNVKS